MSVTFPIHETIIDRNAAHETLIGDVEYDTLIFRGNDLVSIEPRGKVRPLYEREQFRESEPKYRRVTRFISNETIKW